MADKITREELAKLLETDEVTLVHALPEPYFWIEAGLPVEGEVRAAV